MEKYWGQMPYKVLVRIWAELDPNRQHVTEENVHKTESITISYFKTSYETTWKMIQVMKKTAYTWIRNKKVELRK